MSCAYAMGATAGAVSPHLNGLKRGFISLETVAPLRGASFTATWDRHGTTVPLTSGPSG